MNHLLNHRDGSTPLDHDQAKGLKYSHVTTIGELDELEDQNIQKGIEWLQKQKGADYLNSEFICKLHKKLFSDVWKWAGEYRKVEVGISKTSPHQIPIQLKEFFEDVKVWIQNDEMSWDELAAEFHHRLVSIHPFPNGNGRTTRLMTEHLQRMNNQSISTWKSSMLTAATERRSLYIKALRQADHHDYRLLIEFMAERK